MSRTESSRLPAALLILLGSMPLAVGGPHPLSAQGQRSGDPARIILDQEAHQLKYQPGGGANPQTVADDQILVLGRDRRIPIPVTVRRTNSALYTCQLAQTAIRAPALDTVSQFLTKLGPYLTNALPLIAAPGLRTMAESDPTLTVAERLRQELSILDRRVHGDRGLEGVNRRSLVALNRMRTTPHGVDTLATQELRGWLRLQGGSGPLCDSACKRLVLPEQVSVSLVRISSLREELREPLTAVERAETQDTSVASLLSQISVLEQQRGFTRATTLDPQIAAAQRLLATRAGVLAADRTLRSMVENVIFSADSALKDAPKTLAAARTVEALATRVIHATDEIPCESTSVRWDTGKDLVIKVTPRQDAELAGLGLESEREYKVRVLPDWEFHPSVGLSLLAIPRARYPEYEAVKEGDQQYRISRSGRTDSRFDYALTLGLVNRRLDWRRDRNLALWLPEITINPTEDVKLMAVGTAASYRIFKLGTGVAWTRHSVLSGQAVGDVVQTEDVPTRETYGKPKLYLSISLMGLPPFLPN